MKRVGVVILNWNGRQLLEQFLPSLIEHTPAQLADIIVADNASDDDSVAFLEKEYPETGIIRLEKNYGFATGYNRALAGLAYEYVVLLNSDVEVAPFWLEPLVEYLDAHPEVAAAQPKLLSFRQKDHFEYAGASGGYIDRYGYPFCRGRIQQTVERDLGQYDDIRTVFWASGACLFIRLKDFHAMQGFDDHFFAHQEEVDLCWRLASRGRKVVCVPTSVAFHLGAATMNKEDPRKTFLNFRNNLLMLYKNLPEKELRSVLLVRRWLDLLACLLFFSKGEFASAKAVLEARRAFAKMKEEYRSIRAREQDETHARDRIAEIYPKSIIASYFLKGKKAFSRLKF